MAYNMKTVALKLLLIGALVTMAALFFTLDLERYFSLHNLKSHQHAFESYYHQHKILTLSVYFAGYIVMAAFSLPGAAVMTLAGGALFGLWIGTLVVSFASSIGAILAFLASRFLLHDSVRNKFGEKLTAIDDGVRQDGALYLFSLRLVPIFPFFMINLLMGLTNIRPLVFYAVSQLGMLPGTVVYVNAGTQLARIESLGGILSPGLIFSFVLLGLFPLLAKKGVALIKVRRN